MPPPDNYQTRTPNKTVIPPGSTGPTGRSTGKTLAPTGSPTPGSTPPQSPGAPPPRAALNNPTPPAGLIYVMAVVALLIGFVVANQGATVLIQIRWESLVKSVGIIGESLIVLLPMWLAAAGFGWPLRRFLAPSTEHASIVQSGSGLAVLLLADLLLGCLGVLDRNNAWILCAIGVGMLICQIALHARASKRNISFIAPNPPLGIVLAAPVLGLLLVAATCPPGTLWSVEANGYDVLSYHLQLPNEWLANRQIIGLQHNVYSYLPNLVEAGYMQIGAMRGSMYAGIYTAQLFHASCAIFTAVAIFALIKSRTGKSTAAAIAAATFLCLPWVTVTASMAYDEAVVLAFGATALLIAFERGQQLDAPASSGKTAPLLPGPGRRFTGALLIGFLVGAATLAKLPAGPMLALPIGLILLFALNKQHEESALPPPLAVGSTAPLADRRLASLRRFVRSPAVNHPVTLAAAAALAGALTLSPYLIRNFIWTHNPVFPFATEAFGQAHWSDYNVARWSAAHGAVGGSGERFEALAKQWIFNTGYGATEGEKRAAPATGIEKRNIAHFGSEWGFPIFWASALVGAGLGLSSKSTRRITLASLGILAVGVGFWLATTHLQSRFLLPTVLPGCALLGIGIARLIELRGDKMRFAFTAGAVLFVTVLTQQNFTNFFNQLPMLRDEKTGEPFRAPPWMAAGSLVPPELLNVIHEPGPGDDALNQLAPTAKVLVVADNTHLLFLRTPTIYNSAFDDNPLGMLIRGGRPPIPAQLPPAVTEWLANHPIKFSGPYVPKLPDKVPAKPVAAPVKPASKTPTTAPTTRPVATTKPATAPATAPAKEVAVTRNEGPSIGPPPKPTFDPVAVTNKLKSMGITHVWVHWSELDRLTETYGFDPDVNRENIARLFTAGWTVDPARSVPPIATLYMIAEPVVPLDEFNPSPPMRPRTPRSGSGNREKPAR